MTLVVQYLKSIRKLNNILSHALLTPLNKSFVKKWSLKTLLWRKLVAADEYAYHVTYFHSFSQFQKKAQSSAKRFAKLNKILCTQLAQTATVSSTPQFFKATGLWDFANRHEQELLQKRFELQMAICLLAEKKLLVIIFHFSLSV